MITCFEGRIITGYYENKIKAADLSKCARHLRQGQLTHMRSCGLCKEADLLAYNNLLRLLKIQ